MSNTKICPACHKELPVLAVRCKYCGFKQPLDRTDGVDSTRYGRKSSIPGSSASSIPGNGRNVATLPPAPVSAEMKKEGRTQNKKESIGDSAVVPNQMDAPLKNSAKSIPTAPISAGRRTIDADYNKNKENGTAKTKKAFKSPLGAKLGPALGNSDVGFGKKSTIKKRTGTTAVVKADDPAVLDKNKEKPVVRPISPPRTSTPPSSPVNKPKNTPGQPSNLKPFFQEEEEDSLILKLDDDNSQMLLLDPESSGTLELDLDNVAPEVEISEIADSIDDLENAADADVEIIESDESRAKSDKPASANREPLMAVLQRQIAKAIQVIQHQLKRLQPVSVGFANWLKALGQQLPPVLRKLPLKVWIVAGGVLLGLIIGIAVLSGGDGSADRDIKQSVKPADDQRNAQTADESGAKQPGKKKEISKHVAVPGPNKRTCHSLSEYGAFMWKAELTSLLARADLNRMCDAMGLPVKTVEQMVASQNILFKSGYDGIPESSILEVIPEGAEVVGAKSIELLFHRNRLFRVVLNYGVATEIEVDFKDFKDGLSLEVQKHKLGNFSFVEVSDGDLQVALMQQKGTEQSRQLIFTDLKVDSELSDRLQGLLKGRYLISRGEAYLAERDYSEAVDAFQGAADADDALGAGWVGRATAQLYQEDFSGAGEAANKALTITNDKQLLSKAEKILATVALRSGDTAGAISHLDKALSHDSQNTDAALLQKELKTGKYSMERVALTAARMSCPEKLGATPEGLLALGNFPDTQRFFDAMKIAKQDIRFEKTKRTLVSRECR